MQLLEAVCDLGRIAEERRDPVGQDEHDAAADVEVVAVRRIRDEADRHSARANRVDALVGAAYARTDTTDLARTARMNAPLAPASKEMVQ